MTPGITDNLTAPVIVLGMHRSGTSLVTGSLGTAGLDLGQVNTAAPHNRKGNQENERLRACHDRMLTDRGFDWKTPPAAPITWSRAERDAVLAQLAPYAGKAHWGFKDPRTIWLIEGYMEIFPEARLIAPFRHPLAVAQSLAARPGALSLSIDEGLALWRVTNAKLLDLARGHRVTLVRFSDTGLEDPLFSGPMRRFLAEIGLPEGWHGFYDGGLLHHSAGQEAAPPAEMALWDDLIARAQAQAQEPTLD